MLSDNCYAVVMAGGAGTRLWPLSSRDKPKHFLKLFGGQSLIGMTVDKLRGHLPDDRILVLTSVKYREVAQATLPQIPPENFIYEPCLRDTASAIGLAATVLRTRCPAATMIALTADQIIEPADRFNAAIGHAAAFLEGRDFVAPEDVKGIAAAVCGHRLVMRPEHETADRGELLRALISDIALPSV